MRGDTARADAELSRLAGRPGRVGLTAGYNAGTLKGLRKDYDGGLAALREVLERDPSDSDARWNYEVLLRRKQEEQRHEKNRPPEPKPQSGGSGGGGGGGGGAGSPSPNPGPSGGPSQLPPGQSQAPPPGRSSSSGRMSRAEAERLLGALEDQSRAEQQRQRKVRVMTEGRDW
jgi:Ca-activated chloride channel family protein